MYGALDIPWFTNVEEIPTAQQLVAKVTPQATSSEDFWAIRNNQRKEFLGLSPIVRQLIQVADGAATYFDF